jgi:hypothetical protein
MTEKLCIIVSALFTKDRIDLGPRSACIASCCQPSRQREPRTNRSDAILGGRSQGFDDTITFTGIRIAVQKCCKKFNIGPSAGLTCSSQMLSCNSGLSQDSRDFSERTFESNAIGIRSYARST